MATEPWRRSGLTWAVWGPLAAFLVAIAALVPFAHNPAVWPILLLCAVVVLLVAVLASRWMSALGDVRHSQVRTVPRCGKGALDALQEELGRKGYSPVPRDPGKVPFANLCIIDLRGGLRITVAGEPGRSLVYVGPDNDDTRRDLEGVKRVVDAVVGKNE